MKKSVIKTEREVYFIFNVLGSIFGAQNKKYKKTRTLSNKFLAITDMVWNTCAL